MGKDDTTDHSWDAFLLDLETQPVDDDVPPRALEHKAYLLHQSVSSLDKIGWLCDLFKEAGYQKAATKGSNLAAGQWTILWSNTIVKVSEWPTPFRPGQRLNHWPSIGCLTTKANLSDLAKMAKAKYGEAHFDFLPEAHHLPMADRELEDLFKRFPVMIHKPASGSKGEGIFLVSSPAQVRNHMTTVLQRYIEPPDLINGRKYHLRIFVAITSLQPLRVFLHDEGYARLTTEPFQPTSTGNLNNAVHVTNHVHDYEVSAEDTCYYSLRQYRTILKNRGHDDAAVFQGIDRAIGNTVFAAVPRMLEKEKILRRGRTDSWEGTAFEVLGADILVDANMKPWVLEFNLSPSLETRTDRVLLETKTEVFRDLIRLIDLEDAGAAPEDHCGGFHRVTSDIS